jgi:hypothetical protein
MAGMSFVANMGCTTQVTVTQDLLEIAEYGGQNGVQR